MEVLVKYIKPLAHHIQSLPVLCYLAPKQQRVFVFQLQCLHAKSLLLLLLTVHWLKTALTDLHMLNAKYTVHHAHHFPMEVLVKYIKPLAQPIQSLPVLCYLAPKHQRVFVFQLQCLHAKN
jgi:hypothetical protein